VFPEEEIMLPCLDKFVKRIVITCPLLTERKLLEHYGEENGPERENFRMRSIKELIIP
jgi:hypothetical protein